MSSSTVAAGTPQRTDSATRWKLFTMMVLEIFIWGAWLPLVFGYLKGLNFSPDTPPAFLSPFCRNRSSGSFPSKH